MPLVCALWACEDEVISGQATLEVDPPSIEFGKVPSGTSRSVELKLRNGSPSADLQLREIRLGEGSAGAFSLGPIPTSVPRGGEVNLVVTYTPDDAEPDGGHVEILSNALTGLTRVPLSSARTFPRIGVEPSSLELGALEQGGERNVVVTVHSLGDATLTLRRASLRTDGYAGEACFDGGGCREGVCGESRSGPICVKGCDGGCSVGYACLADTLGQMGCREDGATVPPAQARGFQLAPAPAPGLALLPEASVAVPLRYAPGVMDRGPAQLVLESNDPDREVVVVNLTGRPSDLPPVAVANLDGPAPSPIQPGTVIPLSGTGSFDPDGLPITYRWRFSLRPEGSRAQFADPTAERTTFTVDRPGDYLAALTVTDPGGLSSTNDAKVSASAGAGHRVRAELSWDRAEADLDLHLVSPGAPVGSLGDCYQDNPNPAWAQGDPTWTGGPATEAIAVTDPDAGVYTLLVRVAAASPAGPVATTFRLYLEDVLVAEAQAVLPIDARDWDVATLSWPSGLYSTLDTIR